MRNLIRMGTASLRKADGPTIARGAAAVAWGTAFVVETVGDTLERIHRETAPTMGQICTTIERRRIRPEQLREWAKNLRHASEDLILLADRLEKRQ
jgi:hypothetical protein